MEQPDMKQIADIARQVLQQQGTSAISNRRPDDLDKLQETLHNTIMREYPELDANLRFHISMGGRPRPDGPYEVEVDVLRVIGVVKLEV